MLKEMSEGTERIPLVSNANEIITLPVIIIAGITARTSNSKEFDAATAQIPKTMQQFFTQTMPVLSANNVSGSVYAVYTDYESDMNGEYTYVIGQSPASAESVDELRQASLHVFQLHGQKYAKFTTAPGKMPDVVIDAWKHIWSLSDEELGGKRSYKTDFEVYGPLSMDPNNAVVEIYIGIE